MKLWVMYDKSPARLPIKVADSAVDSIKSVVDYIVEAVKGMK